MGCGCGGKKNVTNAVPVTRATVYQVLNSERTVTGEFATIQEARAEAASINGIVRVSSKTTS